MLVGWKFRAAAGIAHSIFELRRGAPKAPPERVRFQQITKRIVGMLFLHLPCGLPGALKIEGIDFFDDLRGFRRQGELAGSSRDEGKGQNKQDGGKAGREEGNRDLHSKEGSHKATHCAGRVYALPGELQAAESTLRSEERRVGKECRSRWSPYH